MKYLFYIFFLLVSVTVHAQADTNTSNTTIDSNTAVPVIDSQRMPFAADSITHYNDSIEKNKALSNRYNILDSFQLISNATPELMITSFRQPMSKDILFYLLIIITVFLGIIKLIFPRYIKNIFSLIFQAQYRQAQTREQLGQDNVASLLLNIFFIATTGLYVTLLISNTNKHNINFWKTLLFCISLLVITYITKLLITQFLGWVFNKKSAAISYSFIVFLVNKALGVILLPCVFILAFSSENIIHYTTNISIVILCILLLVRLQLIYKNLSAILKVNRFHFFIYFCSVEILPLLIVFKLINNSLGNGV